MRNGNHVAQERGRKKLLGVLYLIPIIYYEVSGGPFGVEGTVGAGGPLLAILGFLVFPLVWSMPEALLTAELACAFPENSGYVAWVSAAFGDRVGFMEGTLSWMSGVADNSVYPLLFLEYLQGIEIFQMGSTGKWLLATGLCLVLTYLNWRGLHVVGRVALGLCIFSLLPFVVLVCVGIPSMKLERLLEVDLANVNWAYLLNVLFWNLNYWDSISTLAGEVEQPEKTFPSAVGLSCVLVIISYALPLAIGIGATRDDPRSWDEGHLAIAAGAIGGDWLKIWVILAAAASNLGQFEAEMSSDSYQLLGMAQRGMLPRLLARRSSYGTPTYAIILSSLGVVLLGALSFQEVLELLNFLYCIAALVEFAAYLKLRWSRPDLFSTFKVPLPTGAVGLLLTPPAILIILVMCLASLQTLIACTCMVCLGLGGYSLMRLAKRDKWLPFVPSVSWSTPNLADIDQSEGESESGALRDEEESAFGVASTTDDELVEPLIEERSPQ